MRSRSMRRRRARAAPPEPLPRWRDNAAAPLTFRPAGKRDRVRLAASRRRADARPRRRSRMTRRDLLALAGSSVALAALVRGAQAQDLKYPTKAVTIYSDAPPGSTPDVDARFIADGLGKIWGQQVVVIDRPGANGSIAARAAADAVPDGYTLAMPALSTFI